MADYGLDDPGAFDGLPSSASPFFSTGLDPDEEYNALLQQRAQDAAQQSAAAPAQQQPATPAAPPSMEQLNSQAVAGNLSAANRLSSTADDEGSGQDNLSALRTGVSQAKEAAPDPSKYKPSFGQRVVRGLEGAARGIVGGPMGIVAGALNPRATGGTAYGAPTDKFKAAESAYQKNVSTKQDAYTDAQEAYKMRQEAMGKRVGDLKDASGAYSSTATGADAARNIPIRQQEADTGTANANTNQQRADQESNDSKLGLSEGEFQQRKTWAQGLPGFSKMSPTDQAVLLLTGKAPDKGGAGPATPAEVQIYRAAVGAWSRGHNGQQPSSAADFNEVMQSVKGDLGGKPGVPGEAEAIRNRATAKKENFISGYEKLPNGNYAPKGSLHGKNQQGADISLTPQQFQEKYNQFALDANRALAKHGYQINMQTGEMEQIGQPAAAAAAPSPGTNAAQPSAPVGGPAPAPAKLPAAPPGYVSVQIPGQPPHAIPAAQADAFKKKYPTALVQP